MQRHSAYLVCWTTHGWTDATASRQLTTTLTDGDDNFWLAKRLIQDSTRTSLYSISCCHHCQQNWEAGCPTASSNQCFTIASFRERLGERLGGHRLHGWALVASWHDLNVCIRWVKSLRYYQVLSWATGPLTLLESITEVPGWQVAKTEESSIFWRLLSVSARLAR